MVRQGSAKPLHAGSIPAQASRIGQVAELADALGLSPNESISRAGSTPALPTKTKLFGFFEANSWAALVAAREKVGVLPNCKFTFILRTPCRPVVVAEGRDSSGRFPETAGRHYLSSRRCWNS